MEFSSHRDYIAPNVSAADCKPCSLPLMKVQQSAADMFGAYKIYMAGEIY